MPFFFENEPGVAVTVNGDRFRAMLNEFFSQKLKRRELEAFGFNRMTLRAAQPKLHSLLRPIFNFALSAAELFSFGHLEAAICHRWTIICGVPSNVSDAPISRR